MKKSIICTFVVFVLLMAQLTAMAAFTDLTDKRWDWARPSIDEMSAQGMIKGYEDNTFKPEKGVTKAEALVLLSRAVGYNNLDSKLFTEASVKSYTNILTKYSTPYKNEIAYLLHMGILAAEDIAAFVADTVAVAPLKRYEAAILMTKLLGGDANAKARTVIDLSFEDVPLIPASAKAYVAYVTENKIMLGMDASHFSPVTDVTRAQMALLLYKALPMLGYSYMYGKVAEVDTSSDTIRLLGDTGKSFAFTVNKDVVLKSNGTIVSLSDITVSSKAKVTLKNNKLYMIESLPVEPDFTFEGVYKGSDKQTDGIYITVKKPEGVELIKYKLASSITVTYNDKAASIIDLRAEDYVILNISGKEVTDIKSKSKDSTIKGKITKIAFEPSFIISVDIDGGGSKSLEVSGSVAVKKNSKTADLRSILVGDTVSITLTYSMITAIDAVSTTVSSQGTISEIIISQTPAITITANGLAQKYFLSRSVELLRENQTIQIYDIRLGDNVRLTIESDTVTKAELSPAVNSFNVSGKVDSVNAAYGFISISTTDSATKQTKNVQVFIKKNGSKIIDNRDITREKAIKDILPGNTITAIGESINGVFEATTIIIVN